MGFPQHIDEESEFYKLLDEAQDEWIAEQQAKRQQEAQQQANPDELRMTVEEAERFWRRPDVREILEQWDPYADLNKPSEEE